MRYLTQYYEKTPLSTEKLKKQSDNTKKTHQNFDYTTIVDRLGAISWSNDSHSTVVIKPVYGITTFPLTTRVIELKRTHINKICK